MTDVNLKNFDVQKIKNANKIFDGCDKIEQSLIKKYTKIEENEDNKEKDNKVHHKKKKENKEKK